MERNMTRRQTLVRAGVLTLLSTETRRAWAQDETATERGVESLDAWEDVLLLEVLRVLKMTPAQLQQMAAVAQTTGALLAKFQQEESRTLLAVGRIARKQRETLVSGGDPPPAEQREGANLLSGLQRRRVRVDAEIVDTALSPVRALLTPTQLQAIVWLVHGEAPPNQARSSALLDPSAGFVQDSVSQTLQARLAESELLYARTQKEQLPDGATDRDREGFAAMQADQLANLRRSQGELAQYRANIQATTQRILEGASDSEVRVALRFLIRRLFTSARLHLVLQARLQPPPAQ